MASPHLKSEKNYQKEFLHTDASAKIFKMTLNSDGKAFLLKEYDLGKLNPNDVQEALSKAQYEYEVMKKNIPNVLRSFGSYYDTIKKQYQFSTEFMDTNLINFIHLNGPMAFENFLNKIELYWKGQGMVTDSVQKQKMFFNLNITKLLY